MAFKKRMFLFFWILVIITSWVHPTMGMSRKPQEPPYLEGQVVVRFQDGITGERIAEIVEMEQCSLKSVLKRTRVHLVLLPDGMDVKEALARFESYPEVLSVEPNYTAQSQEEN